MQTVLALVASGIGGAACVPHGRALRRAGGGDGLSPAALALAVVTGVWWAVIAWWCGAYMAAAASAVTVAIGFWFVWAAGPGPRRSASRMVAVGALALPAVAVVAPSAVAVLATGGSAVRVVPQAWRTVRDGAGRAVSSLGWLLTAGSSVLWLVYAYAAEAFVLGAPSLFTLPASLAIARTARRRR